MEVKERIRKELDSAPVVLFMKGTPDFHSAGFPRRRRARCASLG
jgi:glutaredoxin-related protein